MMDHDSEIGKLEESERRLMSKERKERENKKVWPIRWTRTRLLFVVTHVLVLAGLRAVSIADDNTH